MARGEGLRARLARIAGETPKGVLSRPLYLPAVLGTVGWIEEFLHVEYGTVAAGQFSQPAMGPATARQLRQLQDVETLTVEWDPPWLVEQGQDPDDVYRELFAVGRSKRACELLMTPKLGPGRPLLRVNITIRSITPEMRKGEADTMYYVLKIAEWREAKVARAGEGRGPTKLPTTHLLKAGESLYDLAESFYHRATSWRTIAAANAVSAFGPKTPLVQHPRFKVGSKITIPKLVLASTNPPKRGRARGGA